MAKTINISNKEPAKMGMPALTPEARENMMISLAENEAERMMREHNAPSQIITHYLKLGTVREQLELERLKHENELLKAKTKALESQERMEELYAKAIRAMASYSGQELSDDDEEE